MCVLSVFASVLLSANAKEASATAREPDAMNYDTSANSCRESSTSTANNDDAADEKFRRSHKKKKAKSLPWPCNTLSIDTLSALKSDGQSGKPHVAPSVLPTRQHRCPCGAGPCQG